MAARTATHLAATTDDAEDNPAAEPPEPEWVQHLDDPRVVAALDAMDPDHDSAPDADSGRVAALLDGLAPGPDLARVLAGLDPTQLDEAALVEMTAAAQRQGAWSHAIAARAAVELAGRATMTPDWNPAAGPAPRAANIASDELVMRLYCSRRAATTLIAQGRAFTGALVATGEALAAGEIDPIRARVLTDRLDLVPGEVAWQVEDRVLAGADRQSLTEFRRDVERALLEVDPTDARERHERARTTRRVDCPRVLPDGMAELWAVLPARQATRIHNFLDASARTAGDPAPWTTCAPTDSATSSSPTPPRPPPSRPARPAPAPPTPAPAATATATAPPPPATATATERPRPARRPQWRSRAPRTDARARSRHTSPSRGPPPWASATPPATSTATAPSTPTKPANSPSKPAESGDD